ncbi:MAG: RNA polymerase sigma factor RpoD/SigA [Brevinematales bacterium]|nr:RNA polymerase sigma factor RpoD/SigA [Brevinematales bacterium]
MKKEFNSFDKLLKSNSISLYLKEIDKFPLLTPEEEKELAKKSFEGDIKAREKLILSNLRFVVSVAKKYQGLGMHLGDLISEGNIGLITAAERFDYRRGYHFISYAIWWIRQAILKAISEKSRMVRLPMNRANELMQIYKYSEEYVKKNGTRPSEDILSEVLEIEKDDVKKILEMSQGYSSIEEMYVQEENNPEESIAVSYFNNELNHPEEKIVFSSLKESLQKLLNKLPEREKQIIIYRFGLNGEEPQSLSAIGEKFNLTKERIRQIEQWALDQLRNSEESKHLYAYLN